jgi:hypothetical protein
MEVQVSADEQTIKDLEEELANLPATADVFALTREHARMQEQLEGSLAAWEEHSTRLEGLKAKR